MYPLCHPPAIWLPAADVSELPARMEALLRRTVPAGLHTYRFGEVTVNARSAEVTKGGTVVQLTARPLPRYILTVHGLGYKFAG